jgi:hypothetical protein
MSWSRSAPTDRRRNGSSGHRPCCSRSLIFLLRIWPPPTPRKRPGDPLCDQPCRGIVRLPRCETRRAAPPFDLLKEEQDRISRRFAFLDSRIDAGQIEYDQAKAHLQDCLALAGNAHAIYMSLDDSLRRICNQGFFERIKVYEVDGADTVEAEPGEPLDVLFDAELHAEALAYDAALQAGSDAQPAHVAGLNIQHWVGPTGIEPMTSTV